MILVFVKFLNKVLKGNKYCKKIKKLGNNKIFFLKFFIKIRKKILNNLSSDKISLIVKIFKNLSRKFYKDPRISSLPRKEIIL